MQTHKYHFPASGQFKDQHAADLYRSLLEYKLNDGPDCLMAYCIFPTDSAILDRVTIDTDSQMNVFGINLHTYSELWENMDNDLQECVEVNMEETNNDLIEEKSIDSGISIKGHVQDMGLEGNIPDKLYHISSRDNLDSIMKNGIIPDTGANNYKNVERYADLCSEKDLAPWLAVLKHKNNPVILEVDTTQVKGLEQGRMFRDRSYVPEGYGEYRTKEVVPPSAIKEAELTGEFCANIYQHMNEMSQLITSPGEAAEIRTGMQRLNDMGILKNADVKSRAAAYLKSTQHSGLDDDAEEHEYETAENEDGWRPVTPEDECPFDEDFTKSIEAMSTTDLNMKQ